MIEKLPFGTGINGETASLFKISNPDGSYASITDYGATITKIVVPDKDGELKCVVMGLPEVAAYQRFPGFWGATIGRVGNRLGGSKFTLNGVEYKVLANDGPNHLHGGKKGFDKQFWSGEAVGEDSVKFSRLSPDGEEGYPGNLSVSVTFTFDAQHKLTIAYHAETDADTLCNLTNHSYFNLNGVAADPRQTGDILNHTLWLNATTMTACDPALLPNGEIIPVAGTPFDFTAPKKIGKDIDADNVYLSYPHGYDHNFCLDGEGFRKVAEAVGDASGITMETWTDLPGMQFFSSNRHSFCLESQCYPNWNNNPEFPTIVLKKGEGYDTKTAYWFDVR
jgi:aldose 1-epimerase